MEKNEIKGYVEFASHLVDFSLNSEVKDLIQAADLSQIHTFGWPIGVVLHNEQDRPKPYGDSYVKGVRTVVSNEDEFDYWTLDKNGDYYILGSLFEDARFENKLFIDTRTVRAAETLLRTGQLYQQLKVPGDANVECHIEHGNIAGRKLTAANHLRAFSFSHERECSLNIISKDFVTRVEDLTNLEFLKEIVFDIIKGVTEACDGFVPSKEKVTDPIVEAYYNGRVI